MSNVTIKDLPRNEEMDSNNMAAIEGGYLLRPPGITPAAEQAAADQKVQLSDFQITMKQDVSSPKLFSN